MSIKRTHFDKTTVVFGHNLFGVLGEGFRPESLLGLEGVKPEAAAVQRQMRRGPLEE